MTTKEIRTTKIKRKDLCIDHNIVILGQVFRVVRIVWSGFSMTAKCKSGEQNLEIQFYWHSEITVVR
jgi:uncharacterized membrane protein